MDSTSLSNDDLEFLKFHWQLAIDKGWAFFPGTPWFSSEFFAKLRGGCAESTVDKQFEELGYQPLTDKSGKVLKDGRFCFWNLIQLRDL